MLLSRPASRPFAPLAQLKGRYTALRREPAAAQRWQHPAAATPPVPSAAPAQQEAAQPQATQQATQQPAQQQQAAMFLVRNETPVPCTMSSGAFLEASPRGAPPHPDASSAPACKCAPQLSTVLPVHEVTRSPWSSVLPSRNQPAGAYTTARTVGGSAVFELGFHIDRLASSALLMMEADAQAAAAAAGGASGGPPPALPPAAAAVANPAQLRPRVLAAMRAAVRGYRAATGDASGELKLTVLVCWPGGTDHEVAADGLHAADDHEAPPQGCTPAAAAADVFVHVSPLPPRPAPPVKVVMRGAPRQNAAAKDSEWVRQRKALEVGLPAGVNEVRRVVREGPRAKVGLGAPAVQWCRVTQVLLWTVCDNRVCRAPWPWCSTPTHMQFRCPLLLPR